MENPYKRTLSLVNMANVCFKRIRLISIFFLMTVCSTIIFLIFAKPVYQTDSQILIKSIRDDYYVSPTGKEIFTTNLEGKILSEIEILKGRSLAEQTLSTIGIDKLYPDIVKAYLKDSSTPPAANLTQNPLIIDLSLKRFMEVLNVDWVKKSNVIDISFKHSNPQLAAETVNTFVKAYLDRSLQVHNTTASYNFFQEQAERLKQQMWKSEEALKRFLDENHIIDLKEEKNILIQQVGKLKSEINDSRTQEAESDSKVKEIRSTLSTVPERIKTDEEVDANPQIVGELESKLVEYELQEKELLLKYKETSLPVKDIRAKIQIIRNKMAEVDKKKYGKTQYGINVAYEGLKRDLYGSETDLKSIRSKIIAQSEQLDRLVKTLNRLTDLEVTSDRLQHQVDDDRTNYDNYNKKLNESRISEAMDTEKLTNASLIEPARIPVEPVEPKKLLNLLLSIVLGILGGIGLSYFFEMFDDSIGKPEDVEADLNLIYLASIPPLKNL
jgi:polysaccharide biosynthesis protein PslE